MRPTESEIKRCYLARGVFFLLKQFGMIGNSYAAIRQEEWKRRAPALLKRNLFTPSSHRPLDGVFTKVPGDGLYVNTAGKTLPFDSFWRSLRNLVRLRCWPHEDSLVSIVEVALAVRQWPDDDQQRDAWRSHAIRFLVGYRLYLESAEEDLLEPGEYFRRHFAADSPLPVAAGSMPLHRILDRIDAGLAYLGRYLRFCDRPFHRKIFEVYLAQLGLLRERAWEEYDYDGVEDFRHLVEELKRRSFQNEALLIKASLEARGTPGSFCFSDSGFAEANGRRAVWVEDDDRVRILRLSRNAGRLYRGTSFHRLILLDSVQACDYEEEQLSNLTRDLTSLLAHGVHVLIGEARVAQEIDPTFFNYAISEDGVVMRAHRGHDAWRVAKLPPEHREHCRLLENYRLMASETSGRILKLDAGELALREGRLSSPSDLL
ncbi:MAG: hypothetical protein GY769_11500, partial [bacterium]|nr:hypothetical protein [bacterium]